MLPIAHLTTSGDISVCNYTMDENRCPKLVRGYYWKPFMGGALHSGLNRKVASQKVNFVNAMRKNKKRYCSKPYHRP